MATGVTYKQVLLELFVALFNSVAVSLFPSGSSVNRERKIDEDCLQFYTDSDHHVRTP
jgi:hypothetical protein